VVPAPRLYEHLDVVEAAVEGLRVCVKERVAPYKYPRTVWFLPWCRARMVRRISVSEWVIVHPAPSFSVMHRGSP